VLCRRNLPHCKRPLVAVHRDETPRPPDAILELRSKSKRNVRARLRAAACGSSSDARGCCRSLSVRLSVTTPGPRQDEWRWQKAKGQDTGFHCTTALALSAHRCTLLVRRACVFRLCCRFVFTTRPATRARATRHAPRADAASKEHRSADDRAPPYHFPYRGPYCSPPPNRPPPPRALAPPYPFPYRGPYCSPSTSPRSALGPPATTWPRSWRRQRRRRERERRGRRGRRGRTKRSRR